MSYYKHIIKKQTKKHMESNEKSKINGYIFILLNNINQKDSKKISDKIINLNKTYVYINV